MVVKAGYFLHQPQAHTLKLILGVGCGLGFASLPLWFKEVRKREQGVRVLFPNVPEHSTIYPKSRQHCVRKSTAPYPSVPDALLPLHSIPNHCAPGQCTPRCDVLQVAQMRDAQYAESKDDARAARLSPNAGKNAANAK